MADETDIRSHYIRSHYGAAFSRNRTKESANKQIHSYGPDSFELHRLPIPQPGYILGLVGPRSIGKTTALKILAGELKPNLGRINDPPDWPEILTQLDNGEPRKFLTSIAKKELKVVFKPQQIPADQMNLAVGEIIKKVYERREKEVRDGIFEFFDLDRWMSLKLRNLKKREQHKVILAAALFQNADVHIFDDISSFLDMRQRFKVAQLIRSLKSPNSHVIVVDNDVSVIDYVSDYMYMLYGKPEEYGVFCELDADVNSGIEIYLRGYNPVEEVFVRGGESGVESLIFDPPPRSTAPRLNRRDMIHPFIYRGYTSYPHSTINHLNLEMEVKKGDLYYSQIHLVLGDQGTGKSTFLKMLACSTPSWSPGILKSYKPKKIKYKIAATVRQLLQTQYRIENIERQFVLDVMEPLEIDQLMDRKLTTLSPGEKQRVAITFCLISCASVYLIDEPSLDLDSDMRIRVAIAIRKHILRFHKAAVVVENDFLMAAYLADKVILVEGIPSSSICPPPCLTPRVNGRPVSGFSVSSPYDRLPGLNTFLRNLDITFRHVPNGFRFTPRVNKLGSVEDENQKADGNYYYNLA